MFMVITKNFLYDPFFTYIVSIMAVQLKRIYKSVNFIDFFLIKKKKKQINNQQR